MSSSIAIGAPSDGAGPDGAETTAIAAAETDRVPASALNRDPLTNDSVASSSTRLFRAGGGWT
jgi:hypothetical protein